MHNHFVRIPMKSSLPRSFLVTDTVDLIFHLHRTQSFTEASKYLGISQSVASRKLSAFEEALGVTIVDRSSRPIRLTAEGRKLLETCEPFLSEVPQLLESLRTQNSIRSDLRLGVVDSFTREIAANLIKALEQKITHCYVVSGTSDQLYNRFLRDEIDIFVTSDSGMDLRNVRKKFFYGEPSVVVYPLDAPLPKGEIGWSDLRFCGLPYIGMTTGSGGGKLFDNFLLTHDIPINQKFNIDCSSMVLELVTEGMGWSLMRPAGLLQHSKYLDQVQIVPMPKPLLSREIFLVAKNTFPFELFQTIYQNLVRITRSQIASRTLQFAPWLKGEIFTADLATGKKVVYSEDE